MALLAVALRINLPVSLAVVLVINPLPLAPAFYLNYAVGAWLLQRLRERPSDGHAVGSLMDQLETIWLCGQAPWHRSDSYDALNMFMTFCKACQDALEVLLPAIEHLLFDWLNVKLLEKCGRQCVDSRMSWCLENGGAQGKVRDEVRILGTHRAHLFSPTEEDHPILGDFVAALTQAFIHMLNARQSVTVRHYLILQDGHRLGEGRVALGLEKTLG